jgi:alpha-methylacyl-CoA racemase
VLDLKSDEGVWVARRMVGAAEALIEGLRPGVMERLGLGPEVCLADNPAIVYGRMTGYGQDGPLAQAAGHDINYIAISGALGMIGRAGAPPTPPLNLVGDYGGGGMLLAFGVLCALLQARVSGRGQVVDAAMIDGSALLMMPFLASPPSRPQARGQGMLDSGAPFYDAYETSDGGWMSVGAMEPQFYAALLTGLGLDPATLPPQMDTTHWPDTKRRFAEIFRQKSRDDWCAVFDQVDACVAPVLDVAEVASHPHHRARGAFVEMNGTVQPAPAPRFSVTPGAVRAPCPEPGQHSDAVLSEWCGLDGSVISNLRQTGAVR